MQVDNTTKTLKTCLRCMEVRPVSDFRLNRHKTKLMNICKPCVGARLSQMQRGDTPDGMKRCRDCGIQKSVHDFYTVGSSPSSLRSRCKQCSSTQHKFYVDSLRAGPSSLITHKPCYWCGADKPLTEFYVNRTRPDWREGVCIVCVRSAKRGSGKKSKERSRYFLKSYGLSLEQIRDLVTAQNGKCAICETEIDFDFGRYGIRRACVDHDHATGKVRGILCNTCNMHVFVVERPGFVDKAKLYLARYGNA